jgi:uncharacterized Ntn-hydrolase superfamily protein
MMAGPEVWPAMAEAFSASTGSLPRRLLAALDAGEGAGGDVRGRQSAALLVVPRRGEHWRRAVELRVEDHTDPLGELRRLLDLSDAYAYADKADSLMADGRHDEAAEAGRRALELAPASEELVFWAGLGMAQAGDLEGGAERVRGAIEMHAGWRDLLARLGPDISPSAAAVREVLGVPEEKPT